MLHITCAKIAFLNVSEAFFTNVHALKQNKGIKTTVRGKYLKMKDDCIKLKIFREDKHLP